MVPDCSERCTTEKRFSVISAYAKTQMILHLVQTEQRPVIILIKTDKCSEQTARTVKMFLEHTESFTNVRFYNSKLSGTERAETEKWFMQDNNSVLCCTEDFLQSTCADEIIKKAKTIIFRKISAVPEVLKITETSEKAFLLWNYSDYQKYISTEQKSIANSKNLAEAGPEQFLLYKFTNLYDFTNDYLTAWDRNFVLKILSFYSKSWNSDEATVFIQKKLNLSAQKKLGARTWQASDVQEILNQLFDEKKIFKCRWPFKNKIAVLRKKQKTAQ